MRRFALAGWIVAVLATFADANGRAPATSTITFRQGHESDVVAGLTFGAVVSHDSGATWHWFCEKAVPYTGMYDPDYAYSTTGSIFATTFEGLKVSRDGCTFAATPQGTTFVSQVELGPDHAMYASAADPADAKIYKSLDDGLTFPTSGSPGQNDDWWQSVKVAPSDPSRIYVSGYRFVSGMPTVFLMFKSTNGGSTFTAMSQTGITTSSSSRIDIVGISATDPNLLYAKVELETLAGVESVYKSTNAGVSWTKILTKSEQINFLARANGDLVASTFTGGTQKSINGGTSWTAVAGTPRISCLAENAAGEVWACTLNYDIAGSPPIPGDGFGIMKSTNLTTWTGVLKYQDIVAPIDCPVGTVQRDSCQGVGPNSSWCLLKQQLGITSNVIDCAAAVDGPPAGADQTTIGVKPPKGCCDTGKGSGPMTLGLALVVGILLGRRRRR
jgi:uncharacterized protein (TIGR03382 family)